MGKKIVLFIFILFILFIHFLTYNVFAAEPSEVAVSRTELQRFTTVINNIKKYYVRPVSDKELFDNAIKGMVSGLDPHSAYLKDNDFKGLESLYTGTFDGVGVNFVPDNGLLKIITIIDDSPAYKAGIKIGDIIIQINGKLVKNMDVRDAVKLFHGAKGSKITLTILHKNEHTPQTLTLIRDTIKIQTVKWSMLAPTYGYIRILDFQTPTFDGVKKAIVAIKEAAKGKLQGVVIDLRDNPGGLFGSAINVTNCLLDFDKLKENKSIAYIKGRRDNANIIASAGSSSLLHSAPIVVLINGGTASAAEDVAGALQDHKRAIIAGTKSYGKSSAQIRLRLDKQSAIKLTTALTYTPLGHLIQARGIVPDVMITDIKIPENNQISEPVGEENLVDHIQNGSGESDDVMQQMRETLQIQQNNELALAHKDYQLYEALHLLEGLNAVAQ